MAPGLRQRPGAGRDALGAGTAQKAGDLILETDELGSFVRNKRDTWWIGVALDAETRQVVAMVAGDRSAATAPCLWDNLPKEYRDQAILCTDYWSAYGGGGAGRAARGGGKEEGLTNPVERFGCTLRRRCARVVRKTLSFSKCALNHIGALGYFIRHYNESLM